MTDDDKALCARLRHNVTHGWPDNVDLVACGEAADCIEALSADLALAVGEANGAGAERAFWKERADAAEAKVARLVEALGKLHHAVCGETGFAQCVRDVSGIAYPWPALDEADELARAALAEVGEQ